MYLSHELCQKIYIFFSLIIINKNQARNKINLSNIVMILRNQGKNKNIIKNQVIVCRSFFGHILFLVENKDIYTHT